MLTSRSVDPLVTRALFRSSKPALARRFVPVAGSFIVAAAFLRSSLDHLTNSYYFLGSVFSYGLVGPQVGTAIAVVLPLLQLLLGLCLLGRICAGGALLTCTALLLLFLSVQVAALVRGLEIPCGCFGAASDVPIGLKSLSLTGLLLAVAFVSWVATLQERIQVCHAGEKS